MRLPHFLIIGSMKAGTTSLYRDLLTNDRVFMPARKEPNNLCDDHVLTEKGRAEYAALFDAAREGQVLGEASTSYTKLPDFPGVPERCMKVLGADVKLIYLVRDPVVRAISHHRHASELGVITSPIDEAVHQHPMLVNYSKYAVQLRAWRDVYGQDSVMVIRFEDYVKDRPSWTARVSEHLGIEPRPDLVEVEKVFNKAEDKRVSKGPFALIQRQPIYRKMIKPLLPRSIRERASRNLLPKAEGDVAPPSESTLKFLIDQLRDDSRELASMVGSPKPWWDLERNLEKAGAPRQAASDS